MAGAASRGIVRGTATRWAETGSPRSRATNSMTSVYADRLYGGRDFRADSDGLLARSSTVSTGGDIYLDGSGSSLRRRSAIQCWSLYRACSFR
jgi:hypothetical protein